MCGPCSVRCSSAVKMVSSKSVLRDLSLLKQSLVNSNRLECQNLYDNYQRILRASSLDECHQIAVSIPEDVISRHLMPTDIAKNLSPKTVSADGNCLYSSISVSMTGNEIMCHVLRLLVAAELYLEADFYAQHPYFKECSKKHGISYSENALFALSLSNDYPDMRNRRDVVVQEAKATCNNTTYGALLQIMAIALVSGRQIFAAYPHTNNTAVRVFCQGFVSPRMPLLKERASQQNVFLIMWTRTSDQ